MTENKQNYLNNNVALIEKLVDSGRKQGWFPVKNGKCFKTARCSNPAEVNGQKACGGMTAITFRNGNNVEKAKCFRCFH